MGWPYGDTPWNDPGAAPPPIRFAGEDVMAALRSWWTAREDLHPRVAAVETADGAASAAWHVEAPEGQDPPYLCWFVASEAEESRTTAWAGLETVVQVNAHAETDAEAAAIRAAVRAAVLAAPLSVGGVPVRHVLAGGQALARGEGFLRGGRDSWVATFEIIIQHETDIA